MIAKTLIRSILFTGIISVLVSCGGSSNEVDDNIIPRDKMIEILADVQIFESTNQILKDKDDFDFEIYMAYKWVFDQYGVTEQSFKESVDYYSSNPREFELMYDEVIIRITEKQAEMTAS